MRCVYIHPQGPNQTLQHYENLTPLSDCGMSPSNSEPALARNSIALSAGPIESEDCIEDLKAKAGAV